MKKLTLLFFACCVSPCWGQTMGSSSYGYSTKLTWSDNTNNAKSFSVWHAMPSSPVVVGGVSGHDTAGNVYHYFWTSTGSVWEYIDYWAATNPNTWVQHPEFGTDISMLAYGYGALWKLAGSNDCSGTGHTTRYWNGSAWVAPTYNICATDVSVSDFDGSVYAISYGTGVAYAFNSVGFSAQAGGPYMHIAAVDSCTAYMTTTTDTSVWKKYQCTGTAVQKLSWAAPSIGDRLTLAGDVFWFLDGGGKAYKMNSGGGLDRLAGGPFSAISSCESVFCTIAIVSSGTAYRFPDQALGTALSLSGSANCTGSCSGILHSAHVQLQFATNSHIGGAQAYINSFAPTTPINLTSSDLEWDPLLCFDGSCSFQESGDVICNVAGDLALLGILNPLSCLLNFVPPRPVGWAHGSTVSVYIDSTYYPPGSTGYSALCTGITAWSLFNGVSYVCLHSAAVPSPEPSGDYIFVTQESGARGSTDPCGPPPYRNIPSSCPKSGHHLRRVWMKIDNTLSTLHQFEGEGVHEEGHDNFMDNCNGCQTGGSVMGSQATSSPDQPISPTACDIFWHAVYDLAY